MYTVRALIRMCRYKSGRMPSNTEKGFTMVETLLVLAIIIILTGSVGFIGFKYIDKAKQVQAGRQIETYVIALHAYYLDCERYPTEDQGLDALWRKPSSSPVPDEWDGPYITSAVGYDPWDNPYEYMAPGPEGLPFGIRSLGADGMEGGSGKDADLSSWED